MKKLISMLLIVFQLFTTIMTFSKGVNNLKASIDDQDPDLGLINEYYIG